MSMRTTAGAIEESPRVTARTLTVIAPRRGWVGVDFAELWAYRELLYFLVWRDVKVRYKQTILGASWAVLQPLLTMVVFTLFFGRLARIPSDGVPYPLFSYAALVPWTFFATGLAAAAASLVSGANLIRKIYFPRLLMPVAAVAAGGVDFAIAFAVLVAMMLVYGFVPGLAVLWLPLLALLALVTALGVGTWAAAFNLQFRDVRYVVPFGVQLWLFATPIAYPSSLLAEPWRTLYAVNPMVGVVEGFRWALLGTATRPGPMIAVSAAAALVIFVTGVLYFRRVERGFADLV